MITGITPQKEFHTPLTCFKDDRTSALGGGRHPSFHPNTGLCPWDADAEWRQGERVTWSWRKSKTGRSSHPMETQKGTFFFHFFPMGGTLLPHWLLFSPTGPLETAWVPNSIWSPWMLSENKTFHDKHDPLPAIIITHAVWAIPEMDPKLGKNSWERVTAHGILFCSSEDKPEVTLVCLKGGWGNAMGLQQMRPGSWLVYPNVSVATRNRI